MLFVDPFLARRTQVTKYATRNFDNATDVPAGDYQTQDVKAARSA
jgi:hypothetical protein